MKYDYRYKYLQLIAGSQKIIIELNEDTTLGGKTFGAKSDFMFQDEYGDWGHAVGVGKNEQAALNMCINEIENYTGYHIDTSLITEINLPKKIVFEYKKRIITLNIEQIDNNYSILTPKGRKNIVTDNLVECISKNPKEFIKDNIDGYSEQFFKLYNFDKPFDALTKKYTLNNSLNKNN